MNKMEKRGWVEGGEEEGRGRGRRLHVFSLSFVSVYTGHGVTGTLHVMHIISASSTLGEVYMMTCV